MSENVAIIVVPRDRFSTFPACLEALYANTRPPFRVVVVAPGVDAATARFLEEFAGAHENLEVIPSPLLALQGEARLAGLRRADERYCVILENDTLVHRGWLEGLLACMREESCAVVMPLIHWYRGIHSAGCTVSEVKTNEGLRLDHAIVYTDIRRKSIDYPECHCILIDRLLLGGARIFEDVEPFDVDLGLELRRLGLRVFLEPAAEATYLPSPPLEVRDVDAYRFRWDPVLWRERNARFVAKWRVVYDARRKVASYRRQQRKLGVARWFPNRLTVGVANGVFVLTNAILARIRGTRASVPGVRSASRGGDLPGITSSPA